jgi:hypothetical protein
MGYNLPRSTTASVASLLFQALTPAMLSALLIVAPTALQITFNAQILCVILSYYSLDLKRYLRAFEP